MTLHDRLVVLMLRLLRVPCGEYGGEWGGGQRWCRKRFGHVDSCAYDTGVVQPMRKLRLHRKGWDVSKGAHHMEEAR